MALDRLDASDAACVEQRVRAAYGAKAVDGQLALPVRVLVVVGRRAG
jgi:hypothetical protein